MTNDPGRPVLQNEQRGLQPPTHPGTAVGVQLHRVYCQSEKVLLAVSLNDRKVLWLF